MVMEEGRKGGRMDGDEGRKEGRRERRKERRMNGGGERTEGRKDGW